MIEIGFLHDDIRWRWVTIITTRMLCQYPTGVALIDKGSWQSILVVVVTYGNTIECHCANGLLVTTRVGLASHLGQCH